MYIGYSPTLRPTAAPPLQQVRSRLLWPGRGRDMTHPGSLPAAHVSAPRAPPMIHEICHWLRLRHGRRRSAGAGGSLRRSQMRMRTRTGELSGASREKEIIYSLAQNDHSPARLRPFECLADFAKQLKAPPSAQLLAAAGKVDLDLARSEPRSSFVRKLVFLSPAPVYNLRGSVRLGSVWFGSVRRGQDRSESESESHSDLREFRRNRNQPKRRRRAPRQWLRFI